MPLGAGVGRCGARMLSVPSDPHEQRLKPPSLLVAAIWCKRRSMNSGAKGRRFESCQAYHSFVAKERSLIESSAASRCFRIGLAREEVGTPATAWCMARPWRRTSMRRRSPYLPFVLSRGTNWWTAVLHGLNAKPARAHPPGASPGQFLHSMPTTSR